MNRRGGVGPSEDQLQPLGTVNGDAAPIRRRRKDELVAASTGRPRASHALAVKVHWALRIGVALEFLGHGLAGFYRPPGWIPYFTFFGIPETFAHDYMTYITGTVDIALAIVLLLRPMRAVMLHMAVWGLLTALLRPLTGESWFELVERGANYGMPLALLVLSGWGGRSLSSWFEGVRPPDHIGPELLRRLAWITRASIALLLVGHGGLGIWAAKQEWFDFLGWFGVTDAAQAVDLMIWVGVFEVVLGIAVLWRPLRSLLVLVLLWKLGTELLRRLVGQPNYQFVERAGDYVLPLVLLWLAGAGLPLLIAVQTPSETPRRPIRSGETRYVTVTQFDRDLVRDHPQRLRRGQHRARVAALASDSEGTPVSRRRRGRPAR